MEKQPTKRIFVVEDHPIFRHGLVSLIQSDSAFTVCGEAASCAETLEKLRSVSADVVITDVGLEGTNGIELIKHVRAEHPEMKLLVLSLYDESLYAVRALRAGANGYVMKRESGDTLLRALHQIMTGEIYVSPEFSKQLIFQTVRGGDKSPLETLTDRELEVLQLLGQGLASREIAERLHLSVKTVESHRLHLKDKLHLSNAAQLVRFAVQWMDQSPTAAEAAERAERAAAVETAVAAV